MRRMFPVHTIPEEFKNSTISNHFRFVFQENSCRKIILLSRRHRYREATFSKCLPSKLKRKACVFKIFRFAERFRKAPLSLRITVHDKPNHRIRNKAAFFNFYGVEQTGAQAQIRCWGVKLVRRTDFQGRIIYCHLIEMIISAANVFYMVTKCRYNAIQGQNCLLRP